MKAVFSRHDSTKGICQYPERKSVVEKTVAPFMESNMSSMLGKGKASRWVMALILRKSMEILTSPFFLGTKNKWTCSMWRTGSMMSSASILSNSVSITCLFRRGNRCAVDDNGWWLIFPMSASKEFVVVKRHLSSNKVENSWAHLSTPNWTEDISISSDPALPETWCLPISLTSFFS